MKWSKLGWWLVAIYCVWIFGGSVINDLFIHAHDDTKCVRGTWCDPAADAETGSSHYDD